MIYGLSIAHPANERSVFWMSVKIIPSNGTILIKT